MTRQGGLLFYDSAVIHDVVAHLREKLRPAIEGVPAAELRARPLEEIVSRVVDEFRLDVPVLDRTRTYQLENEEIDVDVSRDPRRFFASPGPHYVKGIALRVAIPFTGDSQLFRYGTTHYNGPIPADVVGQTVVLTFRCEEPDAEAARREFESTAERIQNALEMVRGHTTEWNQRLPGEVRERLGERIKKMERAGNVNLGYAPAPAKPISSPTPASAATKSSSAGAAAAEYDLFLSHASEDKHAIARPLYEALTAAGVSVWYDEAVLTMGDSLRQKIDEGLARSKHGGVVVISPNFFAKRWTKKELDGLVAREVASGDKLILPVWHEIDHAGVAAHSPTMADRVAARSADGVDAVVRDILRALGR